MRFKPNRKRSIAIIAACVALTVMMARLCAPSCQGNWLYCSSRSGSGMVVRLSRPTRGRTLLQTVQAECLVEIRRVVVHRSKSCSNSGSPRNW